MVLLIKDQGICWKRFLDGDCLLPPARTYLRPAELPGSVTRSTILGARSSVAWDGCDWAHF